MKKIRQTKMFASGSIAILAILFFSMSTIADIDNLSLGQTEYEKGNYQKALTYFDSVIDKQSNNDTALYYRANTLIKLGLKAQALLDYQQALKLTPSPIMQDYCSKAITSLKSNDSVSALSSLGSKYKNSVSKQNQLDESMGTIQLQSALDKVRIIGNGELFAQDYTMKQQLKLAQMKRETEQNIEEMKNAFYYDQYGAKQPMYSGSQLQNYLQQRKQTEDQMSHSIEQSVQSQALYAKARAQLTTDSATNLESQLTGSASPDGIKLDPLGTNLYVRNYDITSSTKPLPQPPIELMSKKRKSK